MILTEIFSAQNTPQTRPHSPRWCTNIYISGTLLTHYLSAMTLIGWKPNVPVSSCYRPWSVLLHVKPLKLSILKAFHFVPCPKRSVPFSKRSFLKSLQSVLSKALWAYLEVFRSFLWHCHNWERMEGGWSTVHSPNFSRPSSYNSAASLLDAPKGLWKHFISL